MQKKLERSRGNTSLQYGMIKLLENGMQHEATREKQEVVNGLPWICFITWITEDQQDKQAALGESSAFIWKYYAVKNARS